MHEGKNAYHKVLKDIERPARRNPHNSRFTERTTWASAISPPAPDIERTLDWKEFLVHSRFDHDATACQYCMSFADPRTLPASSAAVKCVPSLYQQSTIPLSGKRPRYRSIFTKALQVRRARDIVAPPSSRPKSRSMDEGPCKRMVVAKLPPVLPALRPLSPLLAGCEHLM